MIRGPSGGAAGADEVSRRWQVLTELVRAEAEGFAATDAVRFRRDAERFFGLTPPRDGEDALDRCGDASDLRQRWAEVSVTRMNRPPR